MLLACHLLQGFHATIGAAGGNKPVDKTTWAVLLKGMMQHRYLRLFLGRAGPIPCAHELRCKHRIWVSSGCCTALWWSIHTHHSDRQETWHCLRVTMQSTQASMQHCWSPSATSLAVWETALTEALQVSPRQLGPVVEVRDVPVLCQHWSGVHATPRVGSPGRLSPPQQHYAGAQLWPGR